MNLSNTAPQVNKVHVCKPFDLNTTGETLSNVAFILIHVSRFSKVCLCKTPADGT